MLVVMRRFLSINIFIQILWLAVPVQALPPSFDKKSAINSLQGELARTTDATDSMVILSNLFDLYQRQSRDSIGMIVYSGEIAHFLCLEKWQVILTELFLVNIISSVFKIYNRGRERYADAG